MFTTTISPTALNQLIQDQSNVFIIDTRHDLMDVTLGERQYHEAHIPQAHFLHMDRDLSGEKTGHNGRHPLPKRDLLAEKLKQLGLNNHAQVVVYDTNNSMMAARAWWLLRYLGHSAVAVLDGGLSAWQASGLPTNAAPSQAQSGDFTLADSLEQTVDAATLLTHLDTAQYLIVDARAAERYQGDVEPIDRVGGHIPSAVNAPFAHNLTAVGTFKQPNELKKQWQSLFEQEGDQTVVNQCGSGVTACHNILSQHIAGYTSGVLYPGSWSEWSSDPSRPVQTGNES